MSEADEAGLTPEELEAAKEKEVIVRRVRSMLKLAACKDGGGTKLNAKEKANKQLEQWKDVFMQCDRNGSGTLAFEDVKQMARKRLKIAERLVSDDNLQTFFSAIDVDGGGSIDFQEFLQFVTLHKPDPGWEQRIFKEVKRSVRLSMWKHKMSMKEVTNRFYNSAEEGIIDMANSDGSLGPEEMRRFFRKVLNVSKHEAPDKHLKIAFRQMDEDGGGTLDGEEFLDFIRAALEDEDDSQPKVRDTNPKPLAGSRGWLPNRTPRYRPGTVLLRSDLDEHKVLGTQETQSLVQGSAVGPARNSMRKLRAQGAVCGAPFCYHGKYLQPADRTACNTPEYLRYPPMQQTRSEQYLKVNGLPKNIVANPFPVGFYRTASGSKLPTITAKKDKEKDDGEEEIRDNYLNMKGAESLNRVESWLYNSGIDVRGHFHRLQ
eukprot:TRINITY_DN28631_c0_g1_i1.p1 TRINITY_DN28631_c0_g1~~TRINITY_DN28631_c0_g1_i1.p1  ORF type:complete len:431 (-),score=84.38 TRINITY_DN28631_c0_g1_i1:121-1413(-)